MSIAQASPINTSAMTLTFADEFHTLSLQQQGHAGGWATAYDWDRYASQSAHTINGESEIYVDPTFAGTGAAPLGINPFSVNGGVLTITAARTTPEARAALWGHDYTSGLITTSGAFSQTYGYFEMRADLPTGQGVFPAFWLLPQDGSYDGEIDVMENVNGGTQMWNHIHYRPTPGADWDHKGFEVSVPALTEGFHTYGVLWTPQTITWYVDGTAVSTADTPAALGKPMYMLANFAVGGSWAGAPDPAAVAGAEMRIDYIRAYSLDGAATAQPPAQAAAGVAQDGGGEDDALAGGEGADRIRGLDGNDTIDGGAGDDLINGNRGDDLVHAGAGFDTVYGGQGSDVLHGDAGQKLMNGNMGDDTVHGGSGASTLYGGQGRDVLYGQAGNDELSGDRGDDLLFGGAGADRFHFAAGGGADWIGDFNVAEGDKLVLAPGTGFAIGTHDNQVTVDLGHGDVIGLAGVAPGTLPWIGDWLVYG